MQKLKSNASKLLGTNHQVRLQKKQQQIKEEAFQDGDFTQKAHQYLSSPDVLENTTNETVMYCHTLLPWQKYIATNEIQCNVTEIHCSLNRTWHLSNAICYSISQTLWHCIIKRLKYSLFCSFAYNIWTMAAMFYFCLLWGPK